MRTIAILLVVLAAGCSSDASDRPPQPVNKGSSVQPLAVVLRPTPALPTPGGRHYVVRGTYPEVHAGDRSLDSVNARLRAAIVADQRQAAPWLWKHRDAHPLPGHGLYAVFPQRALVSASTVVVSALLPVRYHYPGGTETDDYWTSVTLRVPSAQPVRLGQLFSHPNEALMTIAANARRRLLAPGSDLAASCSQMGSLCDDGLAPKPSNYQTFALTTRGLVVGFSLLCGTSCGRSQITIPWQQIRSYLNSGGVALVNGTRAPSAWTKA